MAQMDKKTLNHQIISMRKVTKQALVRVVHHGTKEIKKLMNRKGAEVTIQKCKRKAENLRAQIQCLNKLKIDDITKFALTNIQDISKASANPDIPLEDKAKTRVACHKVMTEHVNKFRNSYPNWEVEIPLLLSQLGFKYRMKKLRRSIGNEEATHEIQNLKSRKHNNLVNESAEVTYKSPDSEKKNVVKKSDSMTNEISEERKFTDLIVDCNQESSDIKRTESKRGSETAGINKSSKSVINQISEIRKFSDLLAETHEPNKNIDRTKSKISTKTSDPQELANMWDEEDVDVCLNDNNNSPIKTLENKLNAAGVSDPFFITSNETDNSMNQKYNESDGEESFKAMLSNNMDDIDTRRYHPRKIEDNKRNSFVNGSKFQKPMKPFSARSSYNDYPSRKFENSHHSKRSIQDQSGLMNRKQKRAFQRQEEAKKIEEENLHPSWKAKKKQKEMQINIKFEGKKIKFDDD